MKKYDGDIEQQMKTFYETLTEKEKRRYAALEAQKVGYGGQLYISSVLKCSPRTIQRGLAELENQVEIPPERIRRAGGGRKRFDQKKNS